MTRRINRAIELLAQDQAIYYVGGHTGHPLTHDRGRQDAHIWADYINVGMEHGSFDMAGLAEYMRGLVEGGPTRSAHHTPAVIIEAPVNGTGAANVRFNAWQFRQILGRGVHGIPVVPSRIGGRRSRVCRSVPISASFGRGRSESALADRANARRHP
jgi:4-hydroxy-2-oxoheptanedioate aldolase